MDPQWPHLAAVYELLLHLVSSDASTLHQKKKLIDSSFVRQLLLLFDSEDFRERDYLKNITHRIYSKLTQRRALIRRVICNIFFEFVFETDKHNGIGEMLEILARFVRTVCRCLSLPVVAGRLVCFVLFRFLFDACMCRSQHHQRLLCAHQRRTQSHACARIGAVAQGAVVVLVDVGAVVLSLSLPPPPSCCCSHRPLSLHRCSPRKWLCSTRSCRTAWCCS